MLIPSGADCLPYGKSSLSRRVNANSQLGNACDILNPKLIKKGEC